MTCDTMISDIIRGKFLYSSIVHSFYRLTLPVPSAAKAAMGARKGRTAAGMTRDFKGDGSCFIVCLFIVDLTWLDLAEDHDFSILDIALTCSWLSLKRTIAFTDEARAKLRGAKALAEATMAIRRTMMNCIFDILFEWCLEDTSLLELVAVLLKLNRNPNQKPTRGVLTVFDMISRSLCSNCLYVSKRIIEVKQLRSCVQKKDTYGSNDRKRYLE